MIAAGHTGVNASSRLHRGRGHYLNPRKNHLNPKYVSAISTTAPAIQHHIENSSAFSPRAKCSSKSRLLTSAPTVVATLQSEIRRLEHEINIARQTGADYRDDALASAQTQLASAKAILDGEMK